MPILQEVNPEEVEKKIAELEKAMEEEEKKEEARLRKDVYFGADFILKAECTTKATEPNGTRHSCTSQADLLNAPDGCVFNDRELETEDTDNDGIGWKWIGKNGSENDVYFKFSNPIEIIPGTGLTYPKTVEFWVHARSPKGHSSGRGWSRAIAGGQFIRYR